MHIMLGEGIIVRLKSLAIFLPLLASILIAHSNLLHFGERWNDIIQLVCLFITALNNPVVSKFSDRQSDQTVTVTPVITVQPGDVK